jgi:hypothetical protein
MTSKGRVTTQVNQNVSFSNVQRIDSTSSLFLQDITQTTTISSTTRTITRGKTLKTQSQWSYPLSLRYDYVVGSSKATQTTDVSQTKNGNGLDQSRQEASSWSLLNTVHSSDVLTFVGSGYSPSNGKSSQQYKSLGVDGPCYQETIQSLNYVLTGKMKGC